jgi:hypothetical protein
MQKKGMNLMKSRIAVCLAAVLLVNAVAVRAAEEKKSLYDRLGDVYAIATVVDTFIEKLLVNDTLNANPAIRDARARVPKAEQNELLTIVGSTKGDIVVEQKAEK